MKSGIYRYKWLCILSLLIIVGCSQKATVNPDEMIKTDYAQYEQVAINEDDSGQIRLLKRNENYLLLVFQKDGDDFIFNTALETDKPYGQYIIKRDKSTRIVIFIDNTKVMAERCKLPLRISERDFLTFTASDLQNSEDYILRDFEIQKNFQEIQPLEFYTKDEQWIDPAKIQA